MGKSLLHNVKKLILNNNFITTINNKTNVFNGILDNYDKYFYRHSDNIPGVLDSITGILAAYSVNRKLLSSYNGPLFKVRRSLDNAVLDIYANSVTKDVDTDSLLTFAGIYDCYVTIVYDQSGNSNDLTQITTASQPIIVDTGAIIYENNKLAFRHRLGTTCMLLDVGLNISTNFTSFSVTSRTASLTKGMVFSSLAGSIFTTWHYSDNNYYTRGNASYVLSSSTDTRAYQEILTGIYNGTTKTQYLNGTLIASSINAVGASENIEHLTSDIGALFQEGYIFGSDKSSDRVTIETNLIEYYNPTISETGTVEDETSVVIQAEDSSQIERG